MDSIIRLILVFGLFFSLGFSTEKEIQKCPKKVMVLVKKMIAETFTEYRNFNGQVFPRKLGVLAEIGGTLTEIKISEGDVISKDWEMFISNDKFKNEIEQITKEQITNYDNYLYEIKKEILKPNWKKSKTCDLSQTKCTFKEVCPFIPL